MIEIKDDFLCFEDEKINKTKIYTGKFPTLIGENPFQMKGDCILQMFGLIKPEPFNDYYKVRGQVGERVVEEWLKFKDYQYKYFGLEYNGYDLFTNNSVFGGVLDFVIPKRSVNLEVKSTSISKRKDIVSIGGRPEHIAQAQIGGYLGNLTKSVLAYVFFTPQEEELIKRGLYDEVVEHFNFDNIEFIKVDMNPDVIQRKMKRAYNYYSTCYKTKKIPLVDISGEALEKLGLESEDLIFTTQNVC